MLGRSRAHKALEAPGRFSEPAKFLPVLFVVVVVFLLYSVYVVEHALPLSRVPTTQARGTLELVVCNGITAMLVVCYCRCLLTHPGQVPSIEEDPSWQYLGSKKQAGGDQESLGLSETKRSGQKRHCKWCAKYKPDRCHHCRVCRSCILKMDHHCPWIYNCVGHRNHKYFYLLLFYSVIDLNFVFWTVLETLPSTARPDSTFLRTFLLLFCATLSGFLGALVTLFFGFHTILAMRGMTTIEFCEKGLSSSIYDQGVLGNFTALLGDNPLEWLLPLPARNLCDGLAFEAPQERLPLKAPEAGIGSTFSSGASVAVGGRSSASGLPLDPRLPATESRAPVQPPERPVSEGIP